MLGYLLSPTVQFEDINGLPLVGGKVYVYKANTSTLATTYSDYNGTMNTNPVILDLLGHCTVIADDGEYYDIEVYDKDNILQFSAHLVAVGGEGGSASVSGFDVKAGYGIKVGKSISGNKEVFTVSADPTYLATKTDLNDKQNTLSPGNNIIISGDTVSVTGLKQVNVSYPLQKVDTVSSWDLSIDTSGMQRPISAGVDMKIDTISGVDVVGIDTTSVISGGEHNFVAGADGMVSGDCNILVGSGGKAEGNYNAVFGYDNNVSGNYNIVAGKENIKSGDSNYNSIFGSQNSETNGYSCLIAGDRNSASNGSYDIVLGTRNQSTGGYASIVAGGNNHNSAGAENAIFGYQNSAINSNQNLIGGYRNVISGNNSNYNFAAGYGNKLEGEVSFIFGWQNQLSGDYDFVAGDIQKVSGSYNTVFGRTHSAFGDNNTLVGQGNNVSGNNTFVAGSGNNVSGNNVNVIGKKNTLRDYADYGYSEIVLGGENSAYSVNSSATKQYEVTIIGHKNKFVNTDEKYTYQSQIFGDDNNVSGNHSKLSIFGYSNILSGGDAVDTFYNQITNSIVGGVENSLSGDIGYAVVNGYRNGITGHRVYENIAIGTNNKIRNSNSNYDLNGNTLVGHNNDLYSPASATMVGHNNVLVGYGNKVSAYYNVAFGNSNTVDGKYSVAVGYGNDIRQGGTSGYNSVAVGINNKINGEHSHTFGFENSANANDSMVIGYGLSGSPSAVTIGEPSANITFSGNNTLFTDIPVMKFNGTVEIAGSRTVTYNTNAATLNINTALVPSTNDKTWILLITSTRGSGTVVSYGTEDASQINIPNNGISIFRWSNSNQCWIKPTIV